MLVFPNSKKHEFLRKQDGHIINELYEHPATCMSVFRELPVIAKHVIIRILFINQPIARQLIDTWVKPNERDSLEDAVTGQGVFFYIKGRNFRRNNHGSWLLFHNKSNFELHY